MSSRVIGFFDQRAARKGMTAMEATSHSAAPYPARLEGTWSSPRLTVQDDP